MTTSINWEYVNQLLESQHTAKEQLHVGTLRIEEYVRYRTEYLGGRSILNGTTDNPPNLSRK
jgi:hypothetical protein